MRWLALAGPPCCRSGAPVATSLLTALEPVLLLQPQSHADDLASVIATLPTPPVLVGHSFGGMLAEKYVGQLGQQGLNRPPLAGLALLASVPPTGNGECILATSPATVVAPRSFSLRWWCWKHRCPHMLRRTRSLP